MGTRLPAKTEDLVPFLRRVDILDGALVRVTFAGDTYKRPNHGLGRAYRGGFIAWTGDNQRGFSVFDPTTLANQGIDITKVFEIGTVGGAAYTGDVMVWVF